MTIRLSDVRILYLNELRSALRERSIVMNSIFLPIFLYPVLLWLVYTGMSFVAGQTEGFASRVALLAFSNEQRVFKIDLERDPRLEVKTSNDPLADIRNGDLDLLVEILPPAREAARLTGNFRVRLTYDNSKDRSRMARDRIAERLRLYRDRYLEQEAGKLGLTRAQLQQFWVETNNIATERQMGQFILGLMIPIFLIIMVAVGSMHPAIDCTAGEREKSTWETLMTVATSRVNIVAAKYLYVSTMAAVAGILNLAAMMFSMKSVLAPLLGERISTFSFGIPLRSIPLIIAVTVLLAFFISAGMMILASFARTYKEGQATVMPFYFAIMMPVMFLQVPGLEFTPALAAIPVVNICMVFREAVAGVYHWPMIAITLAVETGCIFFSLWLAATILKYEDFILGSYGGSFGKFFTERLLPGRGKRGGRA